MNEVQIILICLLGVLGIAFVIVLFARFNENRKPRLTPPKAKLNEVVEVLKKDASHEEHWNEIWPSFYKDGEINYTKIESILTYIINNPQYAAVRDSAAALLRERVSVSVFGDDEMTEAIETFKREVNQSGSQDVKEAGNALIKKVRRFCQRNTDNKKYDIIIQWVFNAMEIVGFILAIITL